ncbi:transposase [Gillisia sp. Hel_I_86]|uniref:IS1182 family transposase n=1 Tax=Gillisia sp. Hel_I_86 TaxID=1249981 RepID=UPI00119A4C2D|nr:IS1182 family transposase [Gillisia sp. Hel_I_86]TVZ27882.1 transposase [Gillisia sp. Hel_I_86]TVZ27885.1 transposase [Gillisia sp. Hel_I_86]TVZ27889.1 transposase [Gillisia sp. Hel_I_86]TVZ28073.1 transposase [Gillisia sp. Hel_I_86]TVZ28076.1 transposase [Gillisia sp. Hel_I_86]
MRFIEGKNRKQSSLFPVSLEDAINQENEVRAVDIFVDSLDLEDMGFRVNFPEGGRPAYHPGVLLKLFIYGYLNRLRSSRNLERECKRNIELMWLLGQLSPDHNTIANFRKDNPEAIKKVFRATVALAKHFNLIGGKLIAGDGTKLRAQNSKKNNFNKKKIDRHLRYIDNKLQEYNQALEQADGTVEKENIHEQMDTQNKRKDTYHKLEQELDQTQEDQISTSDNESRHMVLRGNITEVVYNVQSTVDAKHCIPIDYEVTNNNDKKAMGAMIRRAKSIIGNNDFTALFDKGYHTGSELEIAQGLGIKTLVAIPAPGSNAPDPLYNVKNFTYDTGNDHYICPQGNFLKTNGTFYVNHRGKSNESRFKQYKTRACKGCPVRELCTTAKNGRLLARNLYTPVYEENKRNMEADPELYRRRQAIVEHPFGTMKRQWGFDHILSKKGKKRASADVGFIFIAYNLRRILNLIGKKAWKELLNTLCACFYTFIRAYKVILKLIPIFNFNISDSRFIPQHTIKSLILVTNR